MSFLWVVLTVLLTPTAIALAFALYRAAIAIVVDVSILATVLGYLFLVYPWVYIYEAVAKQENCHPGHTKYFIEQ